MREHQSDEAELFTRVDQLLADLSAQRTPLPPLCERIRLRKAGGLSTAQIAEVLGCSAENITAWEAGQYEPIGIPRTAYARLLEGLKALASPEPHERPARRTLAAPVATAVDPPEQPTLFAAPPPAHSAPPPRSRPPQKNVTPTGPLAVIDHTDTLVAHFTNASQLILDTDDLVGLLQWTLRSGLHQKKLSPNGQDSDPLIVLTPAASTALHLPTELSDRASLRLPTGHPVLTQLNQAGFRLTRRGFGPWAGIYRPVVNNKRASVQVAIMAWGALSQDGWNLPPLPPSNLARLLGTYADRLLTPHGSTAVCGVKLMTALRPPTKATYDPGTGKRVSGPNPGALHQPFEPAPPEAPDAHPLAEGRPPEQAMEEEAWDWSRLPDQQETVEFPNVVGLDTNMAFVVAASSLSVGRNAPPRHVVAPAFDAKAPGAWYCDLSHAPHDPHLPSPFTTTGQAPTGPAWYTTVTLAYAKELKIEVRPIEAYVRDDHGPYLNPWYEKLRDAYLATMADLGVHKDTTQADYLNAMKELATADPALLALLAAIKATGKGGLGKLREGPRAITAPYTRWPALDQPTWRPDIRAAVVSRARVTLHRKMRRLAETTGRYPLAVLSDCAVYPARTPTALDVVPAGPDQRGIKGLFCLGVNPGFAKEEGAQTMAWYQQQLTQALNPARYIKS
ncbi:helix-turn-helix domain-containing protein [Streptomyces sp. NPDC006173]|uniref:telomere-associated protein Tap n=1 Tax=Streptomyces sp. NPDC006173 TaxID=3155349 RepID=UPI0033C4C46E